MEYVGKEDGSTSIILVGVHGDEPCGIEALEKIIPTLKIKSGRVLIGYGNPKAIKQEVRNTETNLNRMFRPDRDLTVKEKQSYEYSRAQILKKYLDQADALLDIHSSHTPESRPFIICERSCLNITRCLPLDLVVYGFDSVEPGGTDYYMNQNNKIGICVECGYTRDKETTSIAIQAIQAFLVSREHINGVRRTFKQTFIQMYMLYKNKKAFVLSRPFADFENVSCGEIIGRDGGEEISAKKDSVILFARNVNKKDQEVFLLGEKLI